MVAVIDTRPSHSELLTRLRGGPLEAIKWTAFAFMLVDHYAAYVAGVTDPVAEFLGALVLPMFAFAFAVGTAHQNFDARGRLLFGMTAWAVLAQVAAFFVRDPLPLNVLFTFAAALAFDVARDRQIGPWGRVTLVGFGVLFGYLAEFSYPGVALIMAACWWARSGSLAAAALAGALLVPLYFPNQSWGAVFAPAVVGVLVWAKATCPRLAGAFYPAYIAQFVGVALLAWLVG